MRCGCSRASAVRSPSRERVVGTRWAGTVVLGPGDGSPIFPEDWIEIPTNLMGVL